MKQKTIARAFAERHHYRIFESGAEATGGRELRYFTVEHRGDNSRSYTVIVELDRTIARFVPDGCNCPSNRSNEHCKHAVMFMADTGLLADDIHARFDPQYIARNARAKQKKAA